MKDRDASMWDGSLVRGRDAVVCEMCYKKKKNVSLISTVLPEKYESEMRNLIEGPWTTTR